MWFFVSALSLLVQSKIILVELTVRVSNIEWILLCENFKSRYILKFDNCKRHSRMLTAHPILRSISTCRDHGVT
jgi:hypothetical protein